MCLSPAVPSPLARARALVRVCVGGDRACTTSQYTGTTTTTAVWFWRWRAAECGAAAAVLGPQHTHRARSALPRTGDSAPKKSGRTQLRAAGGVLARGGGRRCCVWVGASRRGMQTSRWPRLWPGPTLRTIRERSTPLPSQRRTQAWPLAFPRESADRVFPAASCQLPAASR